MSHGVVMSTYSVLGLNEGVVDGDNLDVGVLDSVAEDDTTDAAETVDADLDGSHFANLSRLLEFIFRSGYSEWSGREAIASGSCSRCRCMPSPECEEGMRLALALHSSPYLLPISRRRAGCWPVWR
jgi:hypothetical protein